MNLKTIKFKSVLIPAIAAVCGISIGFFADEYLFVMKNPGDAIQTNDTGSAIIPKKSHTENPVKLTSVRKNMLSNALQNYKNLHGEFPKTLQELQTAGFITTQLTVTANGEPFLYNPKTGEILEEIKNHDE